MIIGGTVKLILRFNWVFDTASLNKQVDRFLDEAQDYDDDPQDGENTTDASFEGRLTFVEEWYWHTQHVNWAQLAATRHLKTFYKF